MKVLHPGKGSAKSESDLVGEQEVTNVSGGLVKREVPTRTLPGRHLGQTLRPEGKGCTEHDQQQPVVDARLRTETGFLEAEVMLGRFEERFDQPAALVTLDTSSTPPGGGTRVQLPR